VTIRNQVHAFIIENFYVAEPGSLADGDSLLERGIIDSTGVLEIISFLEQHFGVEVEDGELTPENFDSVANISTFVASKLGDYRTELVADEAAQ
jgi:acyl carrier protein